MSLLRDVTITLPAMRETNLITCARATPTTGSTTPSEISRTSADLLVSTGAASTWLFGDVIDRLGPPLGARYRVALPSAYLYATRGSTESNRQIQIGLKLQHGDSSAGGDAVDYSTADAPADRTYFGTARTSNMKTWDAALSTGPLRAASNPYFTDLTNAKRYVRLGVRAAKNLVTTESSGDEHARVTGYIVFGGTDRLPQVDNPTWAYSTTTST